jgi:hypothetical protein
MMPGGCKDLPEPVLPGAKYAVSKFMSGLVTNSNKDTKFHDMIELQSEFRET